VQYIEVFQMSAW